MDKTITTYLFVLTDKYQLEWLMAHLHPSGNLLTMNLNSMVKNWQHWLGSMSENSQFRIDSVLTTIFTRYSSEIGSVKDYLGRVIDRYGIIFSVELLMIILRQESVYKKKRLLLENGSLSWKSSMRTRFILFFT